MNDNSFQSGLSPDDINLILSLAEDIRNDFCDNPRLFKLDSITPENFLAAFCREVLVRFDAFKGGRAFVGSIVRIHDTGTRYDGLAAEVVSVAGDGAARVRGGIAGIHAADGVETFDITLSQGNYTCDIELTRQFRKLSHTKKDDNDPDVF